MKRLLFLTIVIAGGFLHGLQFAQASCAPLAYQQVADEWQVPADVLYAISLVESGRKTEQYGFNLWPWALNIDGQSHYPASQEDALKLIQDALARGTDKIAIGLMQVFWSIHQDKFNRNPAYALDIASNIRAGAKILREFMDGAPDIWTAVGYYYAGTAQTDRSKQHAKTYTDRVQRFYVRHVIGRCHDR